LAPSHSSPLACKTRHFSFLQETARFGCEIAVHVLVLPFYEPGQRHDRRLWGRAPLGIGLDFARQVHQIGRPVSEVRLSEVLAGLSYALDLTEGQRPGHAVRTCLIGMRVADVIGLTHDQRSALFYALLMKDLGCSSNAARFAALFDADDHHLKADVKLINWPFALESFRYVARNAAPGQFFLRRVWRILAVLFRGPSGARDVVRTRCERGAEIARMLGCADETAQAIRCIDEHWDGRGQPYRLAGEQISLLGRIVGLAQTVEVFFSAYGLRTAYEMASTRRGRWFDPSLVDALESIRGDAGFWQWVGEGDGLDSVASLEPADRVMLADEGDLDRVAEAFARVIDAKSAWTYQHSNGVAQLAVELGTRLGMSQPELRELRRAALLHDLGKLGVSNLILDKAGKLTEDEFAVMRRHPEHTGRILSRVGCFRHLAFVASSHHERLDGQGYHQRLGSGHLSLSTRVLCTADICDALRTSRPYRLGLSSERVLDIMGRELGTAIDPDCFDALQTVLNGLPEDSTGTPAVHMVPALQNDYHQAA
jgi:HD-GYP domain-containing protein (c-di-GMP phosphodiesterase class II)